MSSSDLNQPTGGMEPAPEWSPGRGLMKCALATGVATIVLAGLLWPLAWYFPFLIAQWGLRAFLGLLLGWILFAIAQRAAGFAGWPVTAMVVAGALAVLFSHHVAYAVHGVPTRNGVIRGAIWLDPTTLLLTNLTALIGVTFSVILCHRGGADLETLVGIFRLPMRGTR